MFATLIKVALVLTPAIYGVVAQDADIQRDFAINDAELKTCNNARITIQDTGSPKTYYYLVDPKNPCADAVQELGDASGTDNTFLVKVAAGTEVQIYAETEAGLTAWSNTLTVQPGDNTDCLPVPSSSGSSGSSASSDSPTKPAAPPANKPAATNPAPSIVGAANAGLFGNGDKNAAPSARQLGTPVMALSAVAAFVALAL
jgi:hypothetical protein